MSFDDLPDNWSDLPLDTPGLAADVADLFVGVADREGGCVAFLLTDEDGRLVQPMVIDDVPPDADPSVVAPFFTHVGAELGPSGVGVLFVRGRPGSVLLTDDDRRWHEAVLGGTREAGIRLLGAYLATPSTVRAFPESLTTHLAS